MKQYNGAEAKKTANTSEALPAGGYVCKIVGAKEENYNWGSVLVIAIDVSEGDHKDHFDSMYKAAGDNAKWKGTYRLTEPDENSQYFESNKRAFNNFIWAIQESNTGYKWNWDEKSLKGKTIGIIYRDYEYQLDDGRTGWATEACAAISAEDVRKGNFKPWKPKELKNKTAPVEAAPLPTISDDELPF